MHLQQRGAELIGQLKEHILEVLRSHPDGQPGGNGIIQAEVARRAGLHSMGSTELEETCRELLILLGKEGKVGQVSEEGQLEKDTRWRLANG